jgi:cytochrome c-type biogenesis protein CcmH/NrfF
MILDGREFPEGPSSTAIVMGVFDPVDHRVSQFVAYSPTATVQDILLWHSNIVLARSPRAQRVSTTPAADH